MIKKWGRSPYGERGLKSLALEVAVDSKGRSPYGERGLKYRPRFASAVPLRSLSLRRAWIEITITSANKDTATSLSLRRAWIEILSMIYASDSRQVALLTESVD